MKTDDLIQRLGADATPVRPLAAPWQRAAMWLAAALAYVLLGGVASWLRHGTLLGISAHPAYVVQQLALVGIAIVAADAAFASVVPGAAQARSGMILAPVVVLMATLGWGIHLDVRAQGAVGFGREMDWPCVGSIAGGAALLFAGAMVFLRVGAPLAPAATGLLAALAAVSLANVEACVTRAHAFSVTVLIWHGLTSGVVLIAATAAARRVLRWPESAETSGR
jgi:hypothetical protein